MYNIQLKRIQIYTNIVAAITVPILIAIYGWLIQAKIASQSVQKDYVQMATQILTSHDRKKSDELSIWAVKVLQQYSPIPFPPQLKTALEEGRIALISPIPKEMLNSSLMQPPKPWEKLKGNTNRALLVSYIDNRAICEVNTVTLSSLQTFIRNVVSITNAANMKEAQ